MNFKPKQIASVCREIGPSVAPLPACVDGVRLLWAIAGNESAFGRNCTPRHEPAFDVGGAYGHAMAGLLAKFPPSTPGGPSPAACSYGPWQLMFCNAPENYTPDSFNDLTLAAKATVERLNVFLRRFQPRTLIQIGECWNAGRIRWPPSPQVAAYVHQLVENYNVSMPV